MADEHANLWTPLPPDVESTCRGGGLIDYALLTTEATFFTTELGIIDDAPTTPHFPIQYGILTDPHRIKVRKLLKPKQIPKPPKLLEAWEYHKARRWAKGQPKLSKHMGFHAQTTRKYNIVKDQRLYNDSIAYRQPSYSRADGFLIETANMNTRVIAEKSFHSVSWDHGKYFSSNTRWSFPKGFRANSPERNKSVSWKELLVRIRG